jgi:glycosyltransferase involved in cell wall biosynthesis
MKVTIFLLCYNEEILLPHTIQHYKSQLPNATIVIYDNFSTDSSVKIAKENGCHVIQWDSNNEINDYRYLTIKNNCWKIVKTGWIIVADMDEWLCVTEKDLIKEEENNACLLSVKGYDIIGKSMTTTLEDVTLSKMNAAVYYPEESKNLCFYRPAIQEMNYYPGAHRCQPIFFSNKYTSMSLEKKTTYSKKVYHNKHMNWLGLKYIIQKMKKRFDRSKRMREKYSLATHYTDDIGSITRRYFRLLSLSSPL